MDTFGICLENSLVRPVRAFSTESVLSIIAALDFTSCQAVGVSHPLAHLGQFFSMRHLIVQ